MCEENETKCSNWAGLLVGRHKTALTALIGLQRCKMWQCAFCAELNRNRWRAVIIERCNQGEDEQWWFGTLTAHRKARGWKNSSLNIRNGWKKLSNRMRYQNKKKGAGTPSYVWCLELHDDETQNGVSGASAHIHILSNYDPGDYSQENKKGSKWISDKSAECGMGFQTDWQPIPPGHGGYTASYVTKYMTKVEKPLPKKTRRVQTSRDIKYTSVQASDYDWQRYDVQSEHAIYRWLVNREGREVTHINKAADYADFDSVV